MNEPTISSASQDVFLNCYRGNQGAIRHAAYMRVSKVLVLLHVLRTIRFDLSGRAVFDYGFGAGTFFRHCPRSAKLFGVELDSETVREVREMLLRRRHDVGELSAVKIETWQEHALFSRQYDCVVCSHVLEHLDQPSELVRRFQECLKPGGVVIALLPINERVRDARHVQTIRRDVVESWLGSTDLKITEWLELDSWLYWLQPLFTTESGWRHRVAQAISLTLGPVALALGPRLWFRAGDFLGRLTASRPTQVAVVLEHEGSKRSTVFPGS